MIHGGDRQGEEELSDQGHRHFADSNQAMVTAPSRIPRQKTQLLGQEAKSSGTWFLNYLVMESNRSLSVITRGRHTRPPYVLTQKHVTAVSGHQNGW